MEGLSKTREDRERERVGEGAKESSATIDDDDGSNYSVTGYQDFFFHLFFFFFLFFIPSAPLFAAPTPWILPLLDHSTFPFAPNTVVLMQGRWDGEVKKGFGRE